MKTWVPARTVRVWGSSVASVTFVYTPCLLWTHACSSILFIIGPHHDLCHAFTFSFSVWSVRNRHAIKKYTQYTPALQNMLRTCTPWLAQEYIALGVPAFVSIGPSLAFPSQAWKQLQCKTCNRRCLQQWVTGQKRCLWWIVVHSVHRPISSGTLQSLLQDLKKTSFHETWTISSKCNRTNY